jgi:hypothetical protein
MPKWAKFGGEAQAMLKEEQARAEARKEQQDKLWRFSLKPGEGTTVIFLDGHLQEDGPQKGMLQAPFFREHTVKTGPRTWDNFICLQMIEEPCPICDQTGRDGDLCAAFTVIDTTVRHGRDGREYKNERRLFIAKQQTYQALQIIATASGGMAGTVMNVSRTGDRVARVGDVLVPTGSMTPEEIVTQFGEGAGAGTDYESELAVVSAVDLAKRGVVTAAPAPGSGDPGAPPLSGNDSQPPKSDVPF